MYIVVLLIGWYIHLNLFPKKNKNVQKKNFVKHFFSYFLYLALSFPFSDVIEKTKSL